MITGYYVGNGLYGSKVEERRQEATTRVWVRGNSLVVLWLGLCAFTAKGTVSIPGWGTKIPQAMRRGRKLKKKKKVWVRDDGELD